MSVLDVKEIKSRDFSVRIVHLCHYLRDKKEYVMSQQLLRSGTSIGANLAEAKCSESLNDFIHKITIALKEANETEYWLDVLHRTNYLSDNQYDSINADCVELLKILKAIVRSNKENKQSRESNNP